MTVSKGCLIIGLILFVFAAFGFNPIGLNLIALGLAFVTAAQI